MCRKKGRNPFPVTGPETNKNLSSVALLVPLRAEWFVPSFL